MKKINFLFYRYKFVLFYTLIGFVSLCVEFVIIRTLSSLNLKYPISAILAFIVGIFIAFFLNVRFNFHITKTKRRKALIYFAIISSASFLFQYLIRRKLNALGISMDLSRFFISAIFFLIAYVFHRKYSFNEYKKVGVAIYADGVEDIKGIHSRISNICDFIHIDIVDLTFNENSKVVKAYRSEVVRAYWPNKDIEVHIMSKKPSLWLDELYGHVDRIYIHANIDEDIKETLEKIKKNNGQAGIVINKEEDFIIAEKYFDDIDHLLVLAIDQPGFSGQSFNMSILSVIDEINKHPKRKNFNVCVDGGINSTTIKYLQVDSVISGSYVLSSTNPLKNIMLLQTSGEYEKY